MGDSPAPAKNDQGAGLCNQEKMSVKAKSSTKITLALCAGITLLAAAQSQAGYVSYTSADRTAGLGDAINVVVGSGNASVNVINAEIPTGNPLDPWVERGSVEGGDEGPGTLVDGILEITVLSGNWGSGGPLTGTWRITDPNFWSNYGYGAISLHVGNGGGEPDHWIWNLTNGALTGNWDYEKLSGGGGGLSNLKLFSHGTGNTRVPDGGAPLALLGAALLCIGASRRWLVK